MEPEKKEKKGHMVIFLLSVGVVAIAAALLIYAQGKETEFSGKSLALDETAAAIRFYTENCIADSVSAAVSEQGVKDPAQLKLAIEEDVPLCFDYSPLENSQYITKKTYSSTDVNVVGESADISVQAEIRLMMDGKTRIINDFKSRVDFSGEKDVKIYIIRE